MDKLSSTIPTIQELISDVDGLELLLQSEQSFVAHDWQITPAQTLAQTHLPSMHVPAEPQSTPSQVSTSPP